MIGWVASDDGVGGGRHRAPEAGIHVGREQVHLRLDLVRAQLPLDLGGLLAGGEGAQLGPPFQCLRHRLAQVARLGRAERLDVHRDDLVVPERVGCGPG